MDWTELEGHVHGIKLVDVFERYQLVELISRVSGVPMDYIRERIRMPDVHTPFDFPIELSEHFPPLQVELTPYGFTDTSVHGFARPLGPLPDQILHHYGEMIHGVHIDEADEVLRTLIAMSNPSTFEHVVVLRAPSRGSDCDFLVHAVDGFFGEDGNVDIDVAVKGLLSSE